MTSTITKYVCDICKKLHETLEEAEWCESRGFGPVVPEGTIIFDAFRPVINQPQLFVIDSQKLTMTADGVRRNHWSNYFVWVYYDGDKDYYAPELGLPNKCGIGPLGVWPLKGNESRAAKSPPGTYIEIMLQTLYLPDTVPVDTSSPRYRHAWETHQACGKKLFLWKDGVAVEAPEPQPKES